MSDEIDVEAIKKDAFEFLNSQGRTGEIFLLESYIDYLHAQNMLTNPRKLNTFR